MPANMRLQNRKREKQSNRTHTDQPPALALSQSRRNHKGPTGRPRDAPSPEYETLTDRQHKIRSLPNLGGSRGVLAILPLLKHVDKAAEGTPFVPSFRYRR